MAKIIQFPLNPEPEKFGLQRARKKKTNDDGKPAQLNLFTAGKVIRLNQLSVFEEALLMDEQGQSGKARVYYQKAIAEDDCAADAYCNLGIIESQEGNYPKAIDCFTLCLKLNPRHYEAHYNLANLYFDQNDFQLAQLHFQMATELEPEFANAYFNLALVLSINSHAEAASQALAKYRTLVPAEEARDAARLLEDLKKSISTAKNSRLNSA